MAERIQAPDAWRNGKYGFPQNLTMDIAKNMLEAGEQEAKKQGCPMVMAIGDIGGNLIALHRMDNVMMGSIQIAIDKTYTAVFGKMPTASLSFPFKTGQIAPLHFHERWITFNGGYPIISDGVIIGGLGVSGGIIEDLYVAKEMLKAGNFDISAVEQELNEFAELMKG